MWYFVCSIQRMVVLSISASTFFTTLNHGTDILPSFQMASLRSALCEGISFSSAEVLSCDYQKSSDIPRYHTANGIMLRAVTTSLLTGIPAVPCFLQQLRYQSLSSNNWQQHAWSTTLMSTNASRRILPNPTLHFGLGLGLKLTFKRLQGPQEEFSSWNSYAFWAGSHKIEHFTSKLFSFSYHRDCLDGTSCILLF